MYDHPDHRLLAAIYDPVVAIGDRLCFHTHRQYLADDLSGRVLDLGAGTGRMFPYIDRYARDDVELHAIEPDQHMRKRARKRADAVQLSVHLRSSMAEDLPFEDHSFDAVIASMVFCTIQQPVPALTEVARVLRPGGEFRFFEHVQAHGRRGTVQGILEPLWKHVAGGCHLTRRQHEYFLDHSAFDVTEIRRLDTGIPPVRPFVRGKLYRR